MDIHGTTDGAVHPSGGVTQSAILERLAPMRNLKLLLQREPAAVGSLVASMLPLMMVFDLAPLNEAETAAVVVAVNAVVAFGLRLSVTPVPAVRVRRRRRSAAERLAS
jgi:hypothetical protein